MEFRPPPWALIPIAAAACVSVTPQHSSTFVAPAPTESIAVPSAPLASPRTVDPGSTPTVVVQIDRAPRPSAHVDPPRGTPHCPSAAPLPCKDARPPPNLEALPIGPFVCAPSIVVAAPESGRGFGGTCPANPEKKPDATTSCASDGQCRNEYDIVMKEGKVSLKTCNPWVLGIVLGVTLTAMLYLLFRVAKQAEKAVVGRARNGPAWQKAARRLALLIGAVLLFMFVTMLWVSRPSGSTVVEPGDAASHQAIVDLTRRVDALTGASRSSGLVDAVVVVLAMSCVVALVLAVVALRVRRDGGTSGGALGTPAMLPMGPRTGESAQEMTEREAPLQELLQHVRDHIADVQFAIDAFVDVLERGNAAMRQDRLRGLWEALDRLGAVMRIEHGAVWTRLPPVAVAFKDDSRRSVFKRRIGLDVAAVEWITTLDALDRSLGQWRLRRGLAQLFVLEEAVRGLRRLAMQESARASTE